MSEYDQAEKRAGELLHSLRVALNAEFPGDIGAQAYTVQLVGELALMLAASAGTAGELLDHLRDISDGLRTATCELYARMDARRNSAKQGKRHR